MLHKLNFIAMNTLTTTTKKGATKKGANLLTESILTPNINLLDAAKKETRKKQLSKVERIQNLIPLLNVQRLRKLKVIIKNSIFIDKKVILESITLAINQRNKESLQKTYTLRKARVKSEKQLIDLQDKQEFFTIITIIKALKDADKKRDVCKYGILKSKSFKLSSLNLFLTSKQFTDILSNGGLYTFASVKNAVIKLNGLSKDAQSVIFAHGSDVDLLINSDTPFYDKLTEFESIKDRLSL
jgi:hypothetical protein